MKLIGKRQTLIKTQMGQKHIQKGICNQDAFYQSDYTYQQERYHVMAIADGHGGHQHALSHMGSAMASQLSVEYFIKSCCSWYDLMAEGNHLFLEDTYLESWRDEWFKAWQEWTRQHYNQCAFDRPYQASYYGTTLLFAAETPFGLVIGQIGDGSLVIIDDKNQMQLPLAFPGQSHFDQTHSVCEKAYALYFDYSVVKAQKVKALIMTTDGFENAFPYSQYDFMEAYEDLLSVRDNDEAFSSQMAALLDDASHYSGDDVTMGILYEKSADPETKEQALKMLLPTWDNKHQKGTLMAFKELASDPYDIRLIEGLMAIVSQMIDWTKASKGIEPCDINHWYYDQEKGDVVYLKSQDSIVLIPQGIEAQTYYLYQVKSMAKRLLSQHIKAVDLPEGLRDLLKTETLEKTYQKLKSYRSRLDFNYELGVFQLKKDGYKGLRLMSQVYEMNVFEGSVVRGWQIGFSYHLKDDIILKVVKHPKKDVWGIQNLSGNPLTCYYEVSQQIKTIPNGGTATLTRGMTLYVFGLPIGIK